MSYSSNKSFNLVKSLSIGAIIGFLIIQFTGIAFIKGISMEPTLEENNLVILDKVTYKFSEPQKNDIVAIKLKRSKFIDNKSKFFVKRIIGVPGDHLIIKDKKVYLNGELLNEIYTKGNTLGEIDIKIPTNKVFVMGDNRNNSSDSRNSIIGLISYDELIGKILFH